MEYVQGYLTIPPEAEGYGAVLRSQKVPCPYVCLSDNEVNQLAGWVLLQKDLLTAREAFNAAIERQKTKNTEEGIIGQSLLFAAIVTYAKCFTEARGRTVRLKPKEVFHKNKSRLGTHRLMMKIRNKYISHGDRTEHEKIEVRAALNPDLNDKRFITVYYIVSATAQLNTESLQKFVDVATTVLEYTRSQVQKMYDYINQEVLSMSVEDLYENAVFVNPSDSECRSK